MIRDGECGAVDSTGLEVRHASLHYLTKRSNSRSYLNPYYPKLSVVCHTPSHLWLSGQVSRGPGNDAPDFAPTLVEAACRVVLDRVLGDAAYDSEDHHEFCRRFLGIRSSVIRVNLRGKRVWPKTRYRRSLKRRFPWHVYAQRSHVECAFSQHKRVLGSALRARSEEARHEEILLRVIVHNLMILKRTG